MQLVVVNAVAAAVMAATITFNITSQKRLLFISIFNFQLFKFRMLEVNSSYQEFFASKASKLERTGFQPVELMDNCSTAEVMSDRSALPLDFVKNFTS